MKTTLIPNAVLIFTALAFTTIQLNAAVVSGGAKVETVEFRNERIPSITLREVQVTPGSVSHEIFEAVYYQGQFIPSIQLSEVTVKISGDYNNDMPEKMIVKPTTKGQQVKVVNYKGEFIPSINLVEATIVGDRIMDAEVAKAESSPTNTKGVFNLSARQTFDVLINFIVEKGSSIIRHIFPVFDSK